MHPYDFITAAAAADNSFYNVAAANNATNATKFFTT